jgi:hypothetical protein
VNPRELLVSKEATVGLTKHDRIARQIASKKGTVYHADKGVDIRTSRQAIEVEVDTAALGEGIRQLQGSQRARYLAVPNEIVRDAIERTAGTGVGVMNERGTIKKRAK